ncbi:MAG: hypothetical protein Tsb0013_16720 [Phycisphaerales bacterium]
MTIHDHSEPHDPPSGGTAPPPDEVLEAQDRFISTWGKMGSAWGISRTMAEVHALLYITATPMCTDDVMERLQISRGNASMSLRALEDWRLVTRAHRRGDRKDYFVAETDVATMFRTIAAERKKRELDPVLASLYEIRDLTGVNGDTAHDDTTRGHNQRMDELTKFVEALGNLSELVLVPEGTDVAELLAMLNERDA